MNTASWIAVGCAAFIPIAATAAKRQGRSPNRTTVALTIAALIAGLIGILN